LNKKQKKLRKLEKIKRFKKGITNENKTRTIENTAIIENKINFENPKELLEK
jgi:hypothetical protein